MKAEFKPAWLLLWWVIAALWLGSWLFQPTRELWDTLDSQLFYWLNGSLESGKYWQGFWALANWRPFDITAAIIILLMSFVWIYQHDKGKRLSLLAGLSMLLAMILTTRFSTAVLLDLIDYKRQSPSLILEPSYRLSELITWIQSKDYHNDCFPGDHGYVVMACIVFFFTQAGKRWGWLSLVLLSFFMLPRLVSGAHWATDILIGSTTMLLVSLPLLLATPLYGLGQRFFSWLYQKLFGRLILILHLA